MPGEIVCASMGEETGHTCDSYVEEKTTVCVQNMIFAEVWLLSYLLALLVLVGEKKAKAWNFLPPKSSKQSPFTEVKKGNVLFLLCFSSKLMMWYCCINCVLSFFFGFEIRVWARKNETDHTSYFMKMCVISLSPYIQLSESECRV